MSWNLRDYLPPGRDLPEPLLLDVVSQRFGVADPAGHYHAAAGVAGPTPPIGAADGQRILPDAAVAALAAPDCRHRLDWLVVLLCLVDNSLRPPRLTQPCGKKAGGELWR